MLKRGGGRSTLQASKDDNNSLAFLPLSFYMSAYMYVLSTTLDTAFVYLSLE
jgi:hypothetical protein